MYTKKQDNMAVPFSASPSKPMPLFLEQGYPAVLWCVPKRMLNTFQRPTSVTVWCLLLYSFCTEHLWLLRILLCVHICIVELSSLILYKERRGGHWHLHRDCSDSLPPSWTIYWTILTLRLCCFLKSPSSLFLLHYWNTCTSLKSTKIVKRVVSNSLRVLVGISWVSGTSFRRAHCFLRVLDVYWCETLWRGRHLILPSLVWFCSLAVPGLLSSRLSSIYW